MILHLRISNFALLEEIDIDFGKGLSFFTGETGAGKSILIDAICRLLGARAGQDDVRAGASRSVLEAVFDKEAVSNTAKQLLKEWQIDCQAEEDLIIRREIQSTGKSRAAINNYSVTVLQLKQLGAHLMDVFGQHEHQSLLDSDSQRLFYDDSIGLQNKVMELMRLAESIHRMQEEWRQLRQREQTRQRTIDMLQFQIREIEAAKLSEEEEQQLLSKRVILQNAERIAIVCDALLEQVLESDQSLSGVLQNVAKNINELVKYKESLSGYEVRMTEWQEGLNELIQEIAVLRRSLDFEEGSLDSVESRLDSLQKLKRKYGPGVSDILQHLTRCKEELDSHLHAEEREEELIEAIRTAAAEYEKLAANISVERQKGKAAFEKKVEAELKHVAMEKCHFRVALQTAEAKSQEPTEREYPLCGWESVSFEIEPNPGEGFRDLERIASGGELSRLMLALKIVTRKSDHNRSFIFDEIDAGIGGREAYRIGERLKRLSGGAQVLAVTHLPQVAAFGNHHFLVSKKIKANRTTTIVEELEDSDRIRELARMLSGSEITETALKHARELREQVEAESV